MGDAKGRTKRARLWCQYCEKATLHYFSHEQCNEERKRGVSGTYIERTRDLWYKCQVCMSIRRWGQEHVPVGDVTSTRKSP